MKLLLFVVLLFVSPLFSQSKKQQIINLQKELEGQKKINVLQKKSIKKLEYALIETEVDRKQCEISEKYNEKEITKLYKKLKTLRGVMRTYVVLIDSLQEVINPPKKLKSNSKNKNPKADSKNELAFYMFSDGGDGNGNGVGDGPGNGERSGSGNGYATSKRKVAIPIKTDHIEVKQSGKLTFQVVSDQKGDVVSVKFLSHRSTLGDEKLIFDIKKLIHLELKYVTDYSRMKTVETYEVKLQVP